MRVLLVNFRKYNDEMAWRVPQGRLSYGYWEGSEPLPRGSAVAQFTFLEGGHS